MTKDDIVKAYKSNIYALEELIKLYEKDLENLKKIKRNFEVFKPVVENY